MRGKHLRLLLPEFRDGLIPACAGKTRRKRMPERMHRAHPRVCGENDNQHQNSSVEVGSSPRVRGKLLGHSSPETTLGLIPACAGKTTRVVPTVPSVRAHPRVCGENDLLLSDHSRGDGSSPRVRGKRDNPRSRSSLRRLIPACAGKTGHRYRIGRYDTAHPRVCGENRHRLISAIPRRGSSPRVRGKRTGRPRARRLIRLIPACAGKTGGHVGCGDIAGAHPRVCGENSQPTTRRKSPRWLIPACAGKTPNRKGPGRENRAHPRVCGENFHALPKRSLMAGSSPRVRGKPRTNSRGQGKFGLIPACAGKTPCVLRGVCQGGAHPRVCGENYLVRSAALCPTGSSPRVRGKLAFPRR